MTIRRDLIDVDFDAAPEECGLIAEPDEQIFGSVPGDYETDYASEMVPRSRWPEMIEKREYGLRRLIRWTYNQGSEGSCVGNGFCLSWELKARLEHGIRFDVRPSPISVYDRIGRSSRSGAMLSDGAKAIQEGILPLATEENTKRFGAEFVRPATGFTGMRTYRDGKWLEVGRQFCVDKIVTVRGTDAICSALFNDHPVVVGYNNHCICEVDVVRDGRDYFSAYLNSWGQWGDEVIPGEPLKGIGYTSERTMSGLTGYVILGTIVPDFVSV